MKVSVYIATSLDGFIAREDGNLDWLPGSDPAADNVITDEDYGYHAFIDSVDAIVMGRKTFEKVLSFGDWSYGQMRVIVSSRTGVTVPENIAATVESRADTPAELLVALERDGIRHVYVDGGQTIQRFLDAGLVRQVIITRIPILIGTGIPLFGPLQTDIHLRHVETRQFPSGFVQSHYEL